MCLFHLFSCEIKNIIITLLRVGPSPVPVAVSRRTYFYSDTSKMDAVSQCALSYLTEVEEAAEDVLTTKQQVSEYLRGDTTV